jgi:iron complex outermembrane receptor protein
VNGRIYLAILLLASAPASGQEEELEVEMFFASEETVISAARHEQEIGMSPSAITVITREDIEASGATTIPDLLRLVPGMNVAISSPAFASNTTRLNWTNENNHFLVLVDGREAHLELFGETPWALQPILLDDIQRIEIIRGPGSSLYGANALAGVINISTRAIPEKPSAWMGFAAGEVGMLSAGARVSTKIGGWGFSIGGGTDLCGTFVDHRVSGIEMWKLRAVAEYRWSDERRFLVEGGISRGSGLIPSPLGRLDMTMGLRTLRLAYHSDALNGQLYWSQGPSSAQLDSNLEYMGIRLAKFMPMEIDGHTLSGQVQWKTPRIWKPLLVILGGGSGVSFLGSEQFLDANTYADRTSPRYRKPGIDHWEAQAGAFVHGELSPADWVTVTGGLRIDYNTITGEFLSPRLAAVFRPAGGQFIRLGVARAFRKPAFAESKLHLMVDIPDDSPFAGTARDHFQEFMTRIIGNSGLENEELVSLEAGYLGKFLDGRLRVSLDFYYNLYIGESEIFSDIVPDEQGLPDLEASSVMFISNDEDLHIAGSELAVYYNPSRSISLMASWSHREILSRDSDESPKNIISLGGRYRSESGLVVSLYAFSRSEFWNRWGENPAGVLEPMKITHMENAFLVLARLGWRWAISSGVEMEIGAKLFLPVSPFSPPYFRYRDEAGGVTASGVKYGGDELRRMVTTYLQGSF